jgi:serine/threonine-protein kinase RsbT
MNSDKNSACLPIRSLLDLTLARRDALDMAMDMGFDLPEATKIAVVVSELSRNILHYAQEGEVTLIKLETPKKGMKIIARDEGPGIEDVEMVLSGHYVSKRGLGVGLVGSKRMMDDFDIVSGQDKGTEITAVKWLRERW